MQPWPLNPGRLINNPGFLETQTIEIEDIKDKSSQRKSKHLALIKQKALQYEKKENFQMRITLSY